MDGNTYRHRTGLSMRAEYINRASNVHSQQSFEPGCRSLIWDWKIQQKQQAKKISNRPKFFSVRLKGPFGPVGIRDSHPSPATPHCLGVVIVCVHILEPTVSYESPF